MQTYDAIRTKLDIRQFAQRHAEKGAKTKILEAARLTASSMNSQHWRFILVQEPENIETLAKDSNTGSWVKGADFAIIVSVDPKIPGSVIDAGRAVQDMQLAAWDLGIGSGVYTGMKTQDMRRDFGIPDALAPTIVVGFGYPAKKLIGRKNRKPLSDIAFLEKFGNPISLD